MCEGGKPLTIQSQTRGGRMRVNKNRTIDITTSEGKKARLTVYFTSGDVPKTYKKVSVIGHNIGNSYNPDHLTLYATKNNELRFEIYRDGNFFPYYGKFEYV
jgi:hypothetical protein